MVFFCCIICSSFLLFMLFYNENSGYIDGVLRGYFSGILTATQYMNLTQCETLEGERSLFLSSFPLFLTHSPFSHPKRPSFTTWSYRLRQLVTKWAFTDSDIHVCRSLNGSTGRRIQLYSWQCSCTTLQVFRVYYASMKIYVERQRGKCVANIQGWMMYLGISIWLITWSCSLLAHYTNAIHKNY